MASTTLYTFDKSSFKTAQEIESLYQSKMQILISIAQTDRKGLKDITKKLYKKLQRANSLDPRRPDIYFTSKSAAQKAKDIAARLNQMEEIEFLGSRYPHAWLDELEGEIVKQKDVQDSQFKIVTI